MANINITGRSAVFNPAAPPSGNTRLGLFATSDELTVWQSRMTSGPYKSAGDVSTNSPGDWDRIVSNKNTFLSSPSAQRYAGKTADGCVLPFAGGHAPESNRSLAYPLLSAAFYYFVNTGAGDRETCRTAVRDELLAQAGTAGTDFSNTARWCTDSPYGPLIDENPSFDICNWLTRLVIAYDYIRGTLSGANQTTLDTWFLNAATFWSGRINTYVTTAIYPGRMSGDYTSPTDTGFGSSQRLTHYGGITVDDWHRGWPNRAACHIRFTTLVGVLLNNSTLKNHGKRWFKENILYATFSDGTTTEFERWGTGNPCLGWDYAVLVIGSMMTMADALARTGDYELIDYSTSTGYHGTTGGPKSLSQVITLILSMVDGTTVRYGTDVSGNNGNSNYKIDTVDGVSGEAYVDDTWFCQANLYYQHATNKTRYLRTASGAPAYPSSPVFAGTAFAGEWGVYPCPLFMWGQLEGVVDPYP